MYLMHGRFRDLRSRILRLSTLVFSALCLCTTDHLNFPLKSGYCFYSSKFLFYLLFLLPHNFGLDGPLKHQLFIPPLPHDSSLGVLSSSAPAFVSSPFLPLSFLLPSLLSLPLLLILEGQFLIEYLIVLVHIFVPGSDLGHWQPLGQVFILGSFPGAGRRK